MGTHTHPPNGARWSEALSGVDEARTDRVARQLDAVAHPEFLDDVRAVAVHRLLADDQRLGDRLARVALGHELEDLRLPGRQGAGGERLPVSRPSDPLTHALADRVGADERRAPGGGAARLDEVAVDGGLQHVAARSRVHRLEQVLLVGVHREHEDLEPGLAARELAGGLEAGHPRHGDVEDDELDVLLERAADRLGAVVRFGHDFEVGLGIENEAQAAADDRVVVGEEDPGLEPGAHGPVTTPAEPRSGADRARRKGQRVRRPSSRVRERAVSPSNSSTTWVPPRGPGSSRKRASIARARSRMPRMPLPPRPRLSGIPRPSSLTRRRTVRPLEPSRRSSTRDAPAWRAAFVSASWAMR